MAQCLLRFPFCIRNKVKIVKVGTFCGCVFVFSYSCGIDEKLAHVTMCPCAYTSTGSSVCQTCRRGDWGGPGPPRGLGGPRANTINGTPK